MKTSIVTAVAVGGLLTGCGSSDETATVAPVLPQGTAPPATAALPAQPSTSAPAGPSLITTAVPKAVPSAPVSAAPVIDVVLRTERRTQDVGTQDFDAIVRSVLQDPRGWERAGFHVAFDPRATHVVVLAEPAEVDRLCAPYRTAGRYSCQNGSVVAVNAEPRCCSRRGCRPRWRTATDSWPGSLAAYRTMLVNHEVGHLLGQHHPEQFCTSPGGAAAVMAQQSKGLGGCTASVWPLAWEGACAARHEEPIAPPYEASSPVGCGPRG